MIPWYTSRLMMDRLVLIAAVLLGLALPAGAVDPATAPADFFAQPHLWTIHLRLSRQAWQQMHPGTRPRFEPRNAPKPAPATQAQGPQTVISPFGHEYAYVPATLQLDSHPPTDIVLRFKGNLSYTLTANSPRRPMKVEFDHADARRRFLGLATLNLHANPTDPSLLREALAYALFREAGVPAPRTAFAHVFLSVEGLYKNEFLGLYTLVEQVDRQFLERHFTDGSGMLLKPEMLRGLPYLGQNWAPYADRYNPKAHDGRKARQAFIDFLRLVHFADDATFAQRLPSCLALDEFLRFLAMQAMLSNFDSFLTTGHNYYLYRDPRDGRFCFIPWDLNLSFGGFGVVAPPAQQEDLSLWRPHVPPNRLIERIVSTEPFAQRYRQHVRALAGEVFTAEKLKAHRAALEPHLRQTEIVARAAGRYKHPTTAPAGVGWVPPLEQFLAGRFKSIQRQLAGAEAFVPGQSKHLSLAPDWTAHRRGALVQATTPPLRRMLFSSSKSISRPEFLAAARAVLALRPAPEGWEYRALAETLADLLPIPANYVFDPGPGLQWAGLIFRRADADQNGRLTAEELTAGLGLAFDQADANHDGALTNAEMEAALEHQAAALIP